MFEKERSEWTTMRVRRTTKERMYKIKVQGETEEQILSRLLDNEERKTPFAPPKEYVKLTDWEREQLMRHRAEEASDKKSAIEENTFVESKIIALARELDLDKDELIKRYHEIMRKGNKPNGALAMLKIELEMP